MLFFFTGSHPLSAPIEPQSFCLTVYWVQQPPCHAGSTQYCWRRRLSL